MIAAGGTLSTVFFITTKPVPQIKAVNARMASARISRFVMRIPPICRLEGGLQAILSQTEAKEKLYTPVNLVYDEIRISVIPNQSASRQPSEIKEQ